MPAMVSSLDKSKFVLVRRYSFMFKFIWILNRLFVQLNKCSHIFNCFVVSHILCLSAFLELSYSIFRSHYNLIRDSYWHRFITSKSFLIWVIEYMYTETPSTFALFCGASLICSTWMFTKWNRVFDIF